MSIYKFVKFLNNVNLDELNLSLNELDEKALEIFSNTNSDVEPIIIREIKDKDYEFLIWFCFLRANFLRGKDTISNKAFMQFVDFCRRSRNNFYFDNFPFDTNLLPQFYQPKYQQAVHIETVLQQLRRKYNSGYEFIKDIERIIQSNDYKKPYEIYLELTAKFMFYDGIASKIANAIINEITWNLMLLKKYGNESAFNHLANNEIMEKLVTASCFNVMVDIHVTNFFKEKLNVKNVQHSILLFVAKSVKPEVIKLLFERKYGWINEKESLLRNYHEYIGANTLEKLIWLVYFVKKNSKGGNVDNLKFFQLSNDIFL